jgi:hypothetical protein
MKREGLSGEDMAFLFTQKRPASTVFVKDGVELGVFHWTDKNRTIVVGCPRTGGYAFAGRVESAEVMNEYLSR